jgi:hypothetical protein
MRDYPYLFAWCRFMHSAPYYYADELKRAREDKAPADAIYRDEHGRWHRFSEITNANTRDIVERIVNNPQYSAR